MTTHLSRVTPAEADRYRITKFRRSDGGLEARITVSGVTYEVQRWWGSWGTMPDGTGRYQHVPVAWAVALQKRAREFEREETGDA